MPVKWEHDTDRKLFAAYIALTNKNGKAPNNKELAGQMGKDFTEAAIKGHLAEIRKIPLTENTGDNAAAAQPQVRKRKKKTTANKEDDDAAEGGKKKAKKTNTKTKAVENVGEEEGDDE